MEQGAAPQRNPSRTLVVIAVGVLIVIAIAGIVLAGMKGKGPAAGNDAATTSSTPASAAAMTEGASAVAVADDEGPNRIHFAAQSDKLPPGAAAKVTQLAETARTRNNVVVVASKIEAAGASRDGALDLAKRRADAVRHSLMSNGIAAQNVRIEIVEMPPGLVPAKDVDRAELTMR